MVKQQWKLTKQMQWLAVWQTAKWVQRFSTVVQTIGLIKSDISIKKDLGIDHNLPITLHTVWEPDMSVDQKKCEIELNNGRLQKVECLSTKAQKNLFAIHC